MELRAWQQDALRQYKNDNKKNFLVVACPGAGKTTFSLTLAKQLKEAGQINRVIVVVPSDALRTQWADTTKLNLRPYNGGPIEKHGYDGIVTTYQALAAGITSSLIEHDLSNPARRALVIFDEIHHAGDSSAFGRAVESAFANAERRLLLSGTPWRTSGERIPYTSFDSSGMLNVDFNYSYGEAVRDGVCRPISFPVVYGEASWMRDGVEHTKQVEPNLMLKGTDAGDTVRSLLDATPTGGWMREVLSQANKTLESWRQQIPDAAGLIVARDRFHAQQVAKLLKEVTGHSAPVVVSGEDEDGNGNQALSVIEKFRTSNAPWIIAVKMIAEGVDIPRLMVGVYATNVTTNMFFTQVVGRFVRMRRGESARARLFIVPTATMWALATAIENELPDDLARELEEREAASRSRIESRPGVLPGEIESPFLALGSKSSGLGQVASAGESVMGATVEQWQDFFAAHGVPVGYADQVARSGEAPPAVHVEVAVPRHKQEKALRSEAHKLAGQIAHRVYGDHRQKGEVSKRMWHLYGMGVAELGIQQLKHYIEVEKKWLKTGHLAA